MLFKEEDEDISEANLFLTIAEAGGGGGGGTVLRLLLLLSEEVVLPLDSAMEVVVRLHGYK